MLAYSFDCAVATVLQRGSSFSPSVSNYPVVPGNARTLNAGESVLSSCDLTEHGGAVEAFWDFKRHPSA